MGYGTKIFDGLVSQVLEPVKDQPGNKETMDRIHIEADAVMRRTYPELNDAILFLAASGLINAAWARVQDD